MPSSRTMLILAAALGGGYLLLRSRAAAGAGIGAGATAIPAKARSLELQSRLTQRLMSSLPTSTTSPPAMAGYFPTHRRR